MGFLLFIRLLRGFVLRNDREEIASFNLLILLLGTRLKPRTTFFSWSKYGDDNGIPGIILRDGQDYMTASYHITCSNIAGDIDIIKISSQRTYELDAGLIGTTVEVFEDSNL